MYNRIQAHSVSGRTSPGKYIIASIRARPTSSLNAQDLNADM